MQQKALGTVTALTLGLALAQPTQATQILIDEAFDGASVPDGWVFNGKEATASWDPSIGTDKTDSDWFVADPGDPDERFLRLTSSSPTFQRTTAIFGGGTFSTMFDFSISADVRISSGVDTTGADGISFFWLDAASLDLDTYDLGHYQGGVGEWQGAPRGVDANNTNFGAYGSTNGFDWAADGPNLRGYSFEFDHYSNVPQESPEYNHLVRLDDWTHMTGMNVDSTTDPNYYEDVGWVSFELVYSAANENFTYTYTGRDGAGDPVDPITVVRTPTAEQWTEFDQAYFGISAATGVEVSDQDVRNLVVTQGTVPVPGTLALLAFAPLVLLAARRRRR